MKKFFRLTPSGRVKLKKICGRDSTFLMNYEIGPDWVEVSLPKKEMMKQVESDFAKNYFEICDEIPVVVPPKPVNVEIVEDEIVEDEPVVDEIIEDELFEDEFVDDELVEDKKVNKDF